MSKSRQTPRAQKPVRYHLRFQILPGPDVEKHARILATFCRQHAVEEVVLFFDCEEWSTGLLTREAEDRWFDAVGRARAVLVKRGLSVSLNPWATVLHGADGRTLPADRGLEPMVSPIGEVSPGCGAFADPAWRTYIREQFGRFAQLGFRVLWIEDDFRYHGHRPMTWGGGFEPSMIAKFQKKVGQPVTREQIVQTILQPGEPHPWRALWLETWREAQVEVAAELAEAVGKSAPGESRLGLMSGGPADHSAEGRDWRGLFDTLRVDGRVAHRPHFRGWQTPGRDLAYSIEMLDLQRELRPADCEVAPEVENYPMTRWGHSDSKTFVEMLIATVYGSDAMLLDIFPFAANPADREPEVGQMLDQCRPALAWAAQRFDRRFPSCGVGMPYRPDAAERIHTTAGQSMNELDVSPYQASELLIHCGVPATFRAQPVQALFGPLAWVFDDEQIRSMLAGGLLLDGAAAEILCRRGFGEDLGVDVPQIVQRESHLYSLEEVMARIPGAPVGHFLNTYRTPRLAVVQPRKGAESWTQVITAEREYVGGGMVAFENRRGGRVVTYAVVNPVAPLPMNYQRQALWHHAVRWAAGGKFTSPLVTGGAHLAPIHLLGDDREYLAIFSESDDPSRPVAHLPAKPAGEIRATLLAPLVKPKAAKVKLAKTRAGWTATSTVDLPHFGCLVLEWPRG